MDFGFSEEERAFAAEFEAFLDTYATPDVADANPEQLSQTVDTPAKRAFMRQLALRGWLGMSWPREYGGQERGGIYDFLLTEALSRAGAPQPGKGVGIVGKTIIRHGNAALKRFFLPRIIRGEIEFAIGYTEPQAGSDAAAMQLRAERDGTGWRLNGQKIFTTSAHFADWYWVAARTDPTVPKHKGITLFLIPMNHPGLTVQAMPTMGDERTNSVFFDNVWVGDDYVVGELGKGFQYVSEALDLERFTMFTFSPIEQRMEELVAFVRGEERDGKPLGEDPIVRQRIARLATQTEVARVLGLRFVANAMKGGPAPTTDASAYKLYATGLSQRLADATLDIAGPGGQLRIRTEDAPMRGRPELTYRYTVIDTIGGGTSEIQKNIIARRKLGFPPNF